MRTATITAFLASLACGVQVAARTKASATISTAPITNSTTTTRTPSAGSTGSAGNAPAPDVYLNVPELSVKKIELDVEVCDGSYPIRPTGRLT